MADISTCKTMKYSENVQDNEETDSKTDKDLHCENGQQKSKFLTSLLNDAHFRHKIIHTGILCWSLVGSGLVMGMSGPAFLDIAQIINEDITKTTLMFTVANFGYLFGSLGGGILFDRWNKLALLTSQTFGLAISNCLTPYCTTLVSLLIVRYFVGMFAGAVDTGTQADIFYIWGSEGSPYLLALHFTYSIGTLIAPLVTEPFLIDRQTPSCLNITTNKTIGLDDSNNGSLNNTISFNNSNMTVLETCGDNYGDTRVHYAFIIASSVCLTSTVAFCVLYFIPVTRIHEETRLEEKVSSQELQDEKKNEQQGKDCLTKRMKVFLFAFVCLQLSICAVVEDNFGNFLMAFTTVHLSWRKAEGSLAIFVSRITFTLARCVTIFLTKCCNNSTILISLKTALIVGLIGFYLGVQYNINSVIWLFIAIIGVALSSIYPSVINWSSENVIDAKGWVLSILVTVVCVFSLIFPTVFGNLIDQHDPMWFIYLLMILQVFCLLNFGFLITIRRIVGNRRHDGTDEHDKETKIDLMERSVNS